MNSNITPKDKAVELVSNYVVETIGMPTLNNTQAKRCATIVCEEVIKQLLQKTWTAEDEYEIDTYEFWKSVKAKIELI